MKPASLIPDFSQVARLSPSVIALVVCNLIPLAGVILWDWSVLDLFVLFCAENMIIGLMNVIRMITLLFLRGAFEMIASIAFFIVHYGIFCTAHLAISFGIFGDGEHFKNASFNDSDILFVVGLFMPGGLLFYSGLALFISHFFSYLVNFMGRQEYKTTDLNTVMFQPYGRIVILHIAILFGGFIAQALGEPVSALAILVLLKIFMDLSLHVREHAQNPTKDKT